MPRKKLEKKAEEKEIKAGEIEKKVAELANQGLTSEKIGLILKREFKTSKASGVVIGKILKKANLFKDPDIENLRHRVEKLKKHLEKNKHDYKTKRTLAIKEAKLKKLIKYRKTKGTTP